MTRIITGASMSLDGYIAGPNETGFEHLFAWNESGDVTIPTARPDMTFHMTPENAGVWREIISGTGAIVCGRRLYDLTKGWGGTHPAGVPVVVLTHHAPQDWPRGDTPFTFVNGVLEQAIATARSLAGGKNVTLTACEIGQQALNLGLVDEVWVAFVPVLLGGGTSFFGELQRAPLLLSDPEVIPGHRATHLKYRVMYAEQEGARHV